MCVDVCSLYFQRGTIYLLFSSIYAIVVRNLFRNFINNEFRRLS